MPPSTLLVDYGEVISLPQPADAVTRMAGIAGIGEAEFSRRYWQSRRPYDQGCTAAEYWSLVLDRDVAADPVLGSLVEEDMRSWTRLDAEMLDVLRELHRRGTRLSLLSNAPHEIADAVSAHPAFAIFDHLLFSARLGIVKPDPAIYRVALETMGERPERVVFVDDRAENVAAAAAAGIGVVHFSSVDRLRAELDPKSPSQS